MSFNKNIFRLLPLQPSVHSDKQGNPSLLKGQWPWVRKMDVRWINFCFLICFWSKIIFKHISLLISFLPPPRLTRFSFYPGWLTWALGKWRQVVSCVKYDFSTGNRNRKLIFLLAVGMVQVEYKNTHPS